MSSCCTLISLSTHPSVHLSFISRSCPCQGTGQEEIPQCILSVQSKSWRRAEVGQLVQITEKDQCSLWEDVFWKALTTDLQAPPGECSHLPLGISSHPPPKRLPAIMSPQSRTSLSGPAHLSGGHGSGPGNFPALSSQDEPFPPPKACPLHGLSTGVSWAQGLCCLYRLLFLTCTAGTRAGNTAPAGPQCHLMSYII